MTNFVTFTHALADSTRWRIVRLVMGEALCVCELADILGMPQSTVSSHVQIIRKAGMLESERRGKWTYFRIAPDFLELLQTMASFFSGTDDRSWAADTRKAAQRLAQRAGSCCPGPIRLATSTNRP